MRDRSNPSKPGHVLLQVRNVPANLHAEIKEIARLRATSLRAVVLESLRKEVKSFFEEGRI